MCNPRSLRIAMGGFALVAASAAYALACSPNFPPPMLMQLQSVTIDGVEQTDLQKYQKGEASITPTYLNARPDSVDLRYGAGGGETYDRK